MTERERLIEICDTNVELVGYEDVETRSHEALVSLVVHDVDIMS